MKNLNNKISRFTQVIILVSAGLACSLLFTACEKLLEEEVFVEVASNNFFQSNEDAVTAVNAIYAKMRAQGSVTEDGGKAEGWGGFGYGEVTVFNFSQAQTDEIFIRWSKFNIFTDFTMTPANTWRGMFSDLFEGIFLANNILVNIETDRISQEMQNRVRGEALFGRALFYSTALSLYGNIPLITTPEADPLNLPEQATPEQIAELIIADLTEAATLLPESYSASDYGRFTRGAALAWLARFQLNQKNWQASVDAAREVLDLNYSLSSNYADIFSINNQGNPEIILSVPSLAQPGIGNTMIAHTAESDFVPGSWGGHLARNEFYDSFDPSDLRRSLLMREYTNVSGTEKTINDGAMIIKYQVDPGRVGAWAGNDIVIHRLGEVHLTLAEALNELNGPNQESIDLINALRARAFPNDPAQLLQLSDFSSTESLRDHILNERSWELYAENYRREDLIRHGKYVQQAVDRGVAAAQPHHILYPIPQVEIDRNPKIRQNEGY